MSIVVGVDNGPGDQLAVRRAVDEALLRGDALRTSEPRAHPPRRGYEGPIS
jgi:hypothetical protein